MPASACRLQGTPAEDSQSPLAGADQAVSTGGVGKGKR